MNLCSLYRDQTESPAKRSLSVVGDALRRGEPDTLPAWLYNGQFVRSYTNEQNRSVSTIESIPKTGMTGTSKHGPRRSHGAGRRSHGAEPHFEPSMQAI
jgi:hypothetical protein